MQKKTPLRKNIYDAISPYSGKANCGRKARKNIDSLGLVALIIIPRRYKAAPQTFYRIKQSELEQKKLSGPGARPSKVEAMTKVMMDSIGLIWSRYCSLLCPSNERH